MLSQSTWCITTRDNPVCSCWYSCSHFGCFSRWILFMKIWNMLCWTIPAPYLRLCSGDDLQVGDSIPFHWQLYNTNSSDEHNHRFHYSKHSQNRELKITHDYAVMLRNNKLNTWWEIWNKQRGNSFKNNNKQKRNFDEKLQLHGVKFERKYRKNHRR